MLAINVTKARVGDCKYQKLFLHTPCSSVKILRHWVSPNEVGEKQYAEKKERERKKERKVSANNVMTNYTCECNKR